MTMTEHGTIPEDGTPSTSWENIYKLRQAYGSIVAVSHIITPRFEHVTKVFFYEGKSWTADGFSIGHVGELTDTNNARIIAMIMLIQSIEGMAMNLDPSFFYNAGLGDNLKKSFDKDQNVVYHFIAPDSVLLDLTRNSDGMVSFDQSCDFIDDKENNIRIYTEGELD